jgi:hypothetical protein
MLKNERPGDSSCLHPRLALQTTPNGYLTWEYVCEKCGHLLQLPSHLLKQEDADTAKRQLLINFFE